MLRLPAQIGELHLAWCRPNIRGTKRRKRHRCQNQAGLHAQGRARPSGAFGCLHGVHDLPRWQVLFAGTVRSLYCQTCSCARGTRAAGVWIFRKPPCFGWKATQGKLWWSGGLRCQQLVQQPRCLGLERLHGRTLGGGDPSEVPGGDGAHQNRGLNR